MDSVHIRSIMTITQPSWISMPEMPMPGTLQNTTRSSQHAFECTKPVLVDVLRAKFIAMRCSWRAGHCDCALSGVKWEG